VSVLVVFIWLKPSLSCKFKFSLSLFCGWVFVVCGWLFRNYFLTGCLFFSTLSGPHFINHMVARIVMSSNNVSYEKAKEIVYKDLASLVSEKELSLNKKLNEVELSNLMESVALKYMKNNQLETIKYCLLNMTKTMFGLYSSELVFIDSGGCLPTYEDSGCVVKQVKRILLPIVKNKWIVFVIYFEIILFLFLLIGLLGFLCKIFFSFELFNLFVLISLYCAIFIGASLACGYARLRLPIEPFLIILSLKFWLDVWRSKGLDCR